MRTSFARFSGSEENPGGTARVCQHCGYTFCQCDEIMETRDGDELVELLEAPGIFMGQGGYWFLDMSGPKWVWRGPHPTATECGIAKAECELEAVCPGPLS